jgi:hypothetical protein
LADAQAEQRTADGCEYRDASAYWIGFRGIDQNNLLFVTAIFVDEEHARSHRNHTWRHGCRVDNLGPIQFILQSGDCVTVTQPAGHRQEALQVSRIVVPHYDSLRHWVPPLACQVSMFVVTPVSVAAS